MCVPRRARVCQCVRVRMFMHVCVCLSDAPRLNRRRPGSPYGNVEYPSSRLIFKDTEASTPSTY